LNYSLFLKSNGSPTFPVSGVLECGEWKCYGRVVATLVSESRKRKLFNLVWGNGFPLYRIAH